MSMFSLSPVSQLYSVSVSLIIFISAGQGRGDITYRNSVTFAVLTASGRGGRGNNQPVAQGRPEQTVKGSLTVAAVAAPF